MSGTIPEAAYPLFDDVNFAHVVTVMPDGMPQVTPVWVDRDGGTVLLNTALGRAKAVNLERDPRIALCIVARDNPYTYVQVRGHAALTTEGAAEHIEKLSQKYFGRPYPSWRPGEQRVIIRVTPDIVDYHPPRRR
ncbi:MAG: PPOX class F420-dependent oxidoreductase [Euzebyales bacterium]|nr:PPOX class F420-dependent oxidoreductase [Euzebyales bacterium]